MRRREFLTTTAKSLLTAPLVLDSRFSIFNSSLPSQVVSVFDNMATLLAMAPGRIPNVDGVIVDKILSFAVNRIRVSNMVDAAVMKLTGKSTVGKAWESLFPAGHLTPDTTISIKLNLSYGEREDENDWSKTPCPFGPKAALTDAIVLGLTQMLDGTFPVENILLFDIAYSSKLRNMYPLIQGYRPVLSNSLGIRKDNTAGAYGIHWIAPRHPFEIPADAPRFIAAPDFPDKYKAPQRILPPAYQSDFMINVANAKTHREAGITGVMKNTYGCTDNPYGTHGDVWRDENSPFPGTRLCVPVFYKNIDQHSPCILNVLDGLAGVYLGGPLSGRVFHENTITVSRDPVAIDSYLLNLINKYRKQNGDPVLKTDDGRAADGHPNAPSLRIAADIHGLGSISMDGSRLYDLSGSREEYDIPILQKCQSRVSDVSRKRSKYRLDVSLDGSKREYLIESRIENMHGRVIKTFKSKTTKRSHFSLSWNHRDDNKKVVDESLYIWHVTVDGMQHTRVINDSLTIH